MLTSLVCLQKENDKNSKKLKKIANVDDEKKKIFITTNTGGISMKFPEKVYLMLILKVTKMQGFTFSLISRKCSFLKNNPLFIIRIITVSDSIFKDS